MSSPCAAPHRFFNRARLFFWLALGGGRRPSSAATLKRVTISSTSRADYQAFATSHRSDFERWLTELVNIPTVSVDPARAADVRRCAETAFALLEQVSARST